MIAAHAVSLAGTRAELLVQTALGVRAPPGYETSRDRATFERLHERWRAETRFESSLQKMVMSAPYQQIIGMGERALPFIFERLASPDPEPWTWALRAITGEDPTTAEAKGSFAQQAQQWIAWRAEHNGE